MSKGARFADEDGTVFPGLQEPEYAERIGGLERIGLLSTHDRGNATLVGLTHRGMIVADHLAEIQEIMEDHDGSVSGSDPSSKT